MRLTKKFIKTAKPGTYVDDGRTGLRLVVKSKNAKSWTQQLWINGERRCIGLGSLKFVSLDEARDLARANQKKARTGRWSKGAIKFKEAADEVIKLNSPNWKLQTVQGWTHTVEEYCKPLHKKDPEDIGIVNVLNIVKPLWNDKRPTASRILRRIEAILAWCVGEGHRAEQLDVKAILATLPKNGHITEHMKALPYAQVADALATIRKSDAYEIAKLAFEFLVLTGVRSGEVRGARWSEVNFKDRVWTIPASRMKMKKDHRVPLNRHTIKILKTARKLYGEHDLIFPSQRGKQMGDARLSEILKRNGVAAVPHGFRSSLTDWIAEQHPEVSKEIREHCIAHIEGSESERAYRRTDYFELRRSLMQGWADYINKQIGDSK